MSANQGASQHLTPDVSHYVDRVTREREQRARLAGHFPDGVLRAAVVLYVAGYLFHFVGHYEHGMHHTPAPTLWAGTFGSVAAIVMVTGVIQRRRWAPLVTAVVGYVTMFALAGVHFPPQWSPFSEPWRDQVNGLAWASLAAALIGAVAAGAAGTYALGRLSRR